MGIFRFLGRTPRKKTTTVNWGRSHPKEELIQAALPDILKDVELQQEKTRPIIAHLRECKSCAEICCGFWNQTRATQNFAA